MKIVCLYFYFLISLSHFGITVISVSQNELGSSILVSIFKSLHKVGIISSLKVSYDLPMKLSKFPIFFVGKCLKFNFLDRYKVPRFSISFSGNFDNFHL
jgi:hypothetical protein